MPSGYSTPDPTLTANIYASGYLDRVLLQVMVPFRTAIRSTWPIDECYFWLMRYNRGGEHLKIRIYTAPENREHVKDLLAFHAEEFFVQARNLPRDQTRNISKPRVPAIDLEDDAAELSPDLSIVWTNYRRTHVSFPGSPWLEDDRLIACSGRALAGGCELFLMTLESGAAGSIGARHTFLGDTVLSALRPLELCEPSRAIEYLRYHRDWLLRFFLVDTPTEERTLKLFSEQALRIPGTIEWLAERARMIEPSDHSHGQRFWHDALGDLARYAVRFRGRESHQIDPFAPDEAFPPIFKVLHGLGNQIGLRPLQEAYVHHLALTAEEAILSGNPVATIAQGVGA
jgi:hypothetical protein